MKSGSNYTFSHRFEDKFDVRVRTTAETTTDIVQEFVDFLKACQFAEGSIRSALEGAAEELECHVEKRGNY